MGIIKNEIPILEFDTEQRAVLNPTHDDLKLNLPKKCVFAFLGNYIEEYAKKSDANRPQVGDDYKLFLESHGT